MVLVRHEGIEQSVLMDRDKEHFWTREGPRLKAGKPNAGVAWVDGMGTAVAARAAWSLVAVAFWDEAGGQWGGRRRKAQRTFSKDSSRLSPSSVPVPVQSCSIGNAVSVLAPPNGVESSPSEESETEWIEDMEAATCPWTRRVSLIVEKSASGG